MPKPVFCVKLPVPPEKIRYHFIDILKTYAVFMMIIGHTMDAVAAAGVKNHPLYHFFIMIRGLTSASFFIASGAGLYFAFQSKKDQPGHRLLAQRLSRIIPILLAGYFLHLPYLSAARLFFHSTARDWRQLMQCDTLQNICYSIIILQVLLLCARTRGKIFATASVLMLFFLSAAPLLHRRLNQPMILVQLFTPRFGSLFPLFPFAAYIMAGSVLASGLSYLRDVSGLSGVRKYFTMAGSLLFGISFFLRLPVFQLFAFRVGLIMILLSLLTLAEGKSGTLIRFFQAMGRESLVVYLIHLMIVYGSVINSGFRQWWGDTLNSAAATGTALGLATVMLALGWWWHTLKNRRPVLARHFRNILIALLVFFFLIGK